jgi:vanillate O-demethylase monooxygenase subunit
VPGVLLVDTAYWPEGSDISQGAARMPSTHLLTPETEFSTHYLWGSSRNFGPVDPASVKASEEMIRAIFETQDGPMAEAQQRAMGRETDLLALRPAILKADKAGVLARRLIQRLVREQNSLPEPASERPLTAAV